MLGLLSANGAKCESLSSLHASMVVWLIDGLNPVRLLRGIERVEHAVGMGHNKCVLAR